LVGSIPILKFKLKKKFHGVLSSFLFVCSQQEQPTEDAYQLVGVDLPDIQDFLAEVKRQLPDSCMLDVFEEKPPRTKRAPRQLRVDTPADRLKDFKASHDCNKNRCDEKCAEDFLPELFYTTNERKMVDEDTVGQYLNNNWFKMRDGLLTASKIKKVLQSTNYKATAESLLKPDRFGDQNLPPPVAFGRQHEDKARDCFLKCHRLSHKRQRLQSRVPGLILSPTPAEAFLAASPDGVASCKESGKFLVEVKCVYSCKNFHPKTAATVSG
jgi:hypothetical protein